MPEIVTNQHQPFQFLGTSVTTRDGYYCWWTWTGLNQPSWHF